MKTSVFSAQQFDNRSKLDFSLEKYSRFKYGSKSAARDFGYELGRKFLQSRVYQDLQSDYDLSQVPIIVASAPYKFTPTASFALKDYFVHEFNKAHALQFGCSTQEIKIYRAHSYYDDYGSMTKEARSEAITADDFYVDAKFIENKILFSLDDIRITGSHQHRVETLLKSIDFQGHVVFLFYAEMTGEEEPQIETVLNRYAINTLLDINNIIREDEFTFNTRVVKFILHSDTAEFTNFIQYQTEKFNETLLHYAIGNEYFNDENLAKNISILRLYLAQNHHEPARLQQF